MMWRLTPPPPLESPAFLAGGKHTSAPHGHGAQWSIDWGEQFPIRIAARHRHPNLAHRDANQRADFEHLASHCARSAAFKAGRRSASISPQTIEEK
jgi:hypothetical protein